MSRERQLFLNYTCLFLLSVDTIIEKVEDVNFQGKHKVAEILLIRDLGLMKRKRVSGPLMALESHMGIKLLTKLSFLWNNILLFAIQHY